MVGFVGNFGSQLRVRGEVWGWYNTGNLCLFGFADGFGVGVCGPLGFGWGSDLGVGFVWFAVTFHGLGFPGPWVLLRFSGVHVFALRVSLVLDFLVYGLGFVLRGWPVCYVGVRCRFVVFGLPDWVWKFGVWYNTGV